MYQAGIYCRISIEEQNKEGEYSNSIHSQIQMARDYIRCEMTPTSVGGEQQECRGILEKKEEKQWIT